MCRSTLLLLTGAVLAAWAQAQPQQKTTAQQKTTTKKTKGQPAPSPAPTSSEPGLAPCGVHGSVEILCGTRSPEDLELTPDGKYLIVSQMVNPRPGTPNPGGAGLVLLDLATKRYSKIPVTSEPSADWGDPKCPGPIGDALIPHGISLAPRKNGPQQLYVVNHGGRQSIEMFELKAPTVVKKKPQGWSLVWHGCVVSMDEYNDVAVLSDGGFVATHPLALLEGDTSSLFKGYPSGFVSRWSAEKGEEELPGTRTGYPNGVLVTPNGLMMYFNAWTAKEVHEYDLTQKKPTSVRKMDFMPDNLTWTSDRQILAAGVKEARGECPPNSGMPCNRTFSVAEFALATMTPTTIFDSTGQDPLIGGVSVALQVGDSIYLGAFQGERLVKAPYNKK